MMMGERLLTRRRFLGTAAATAAGVVSAPALLRAQEGGAPAIARSRPTLPFGVATGDPLADRAIIWSRADRPARMIVEVSATESFKRARRLVGPAALPDTDFTARMDVCGLPQGSEVFYRVAFQDLNDRRAMSEPVVGRLRTAARGERPIRFQWSGDLVGQGWGIDESRGGLRIFETMRARRPDFFLHSGDVVYADGPLKEEVPHPGQSHYALARESTSSR